MNELIKVTYENDRPVVSARELHEMLRGFTSNVSARIRRTTWKRNTF